jgi:hypothetical protein
MAAARKYLRVMQPSTNEWATPVLFMRCKDGVLFETGEAADQAPHTVGIDDAHAMSSGSTAAAPSSAPPTQAAPDAAASEPRAPEASAEPHAPAEPVIPAGVDLSADVAVWLAEEDGNLTLHWRARSPGLRDFVALFANQPTDPDGYLPDAYEYASQEGSYRTSVPARPGCWVAYIVEDASGEKAIMASWGPTT